jgi:hypothetical protein
MVTMQYDEINQILQDAPEIRLFMSGNPALVISFLYHLYKEQAQTAVLEQSFLDELTSYCDHLQKNATHQANKVPSFKSSKEYLNDWKQRGWVREHRAEQQSVYEIRLTQHTERLLNWMRDMQHREYIATESRFQSIVQQLNELVIASSQDPAIQLQYLEAEQARIQQQIDRIKQTGRAERLDEHTIKERFSLIEEMARQLLSDFALVEDRFHKMGQEVQAAQMQVETRRGAVVGQVVEGDEQLRQSTVGRSFFAFWRFLNARGQKERLDTLLDSVFELPEITTQQHRQSVVRRLTQHLQEAGEKVNESTRRLFAQLNRLLEEQTREENRRVQELLNEIKAIQVQHPQWFDDAERWMELELYPNRVQLPMERPLFSHEETTPFASLPPKNNNEDMTVWQELNRQFYVEIWVLEERIENMLERTVQITLPDLLEHYPPEKGLPEVFSYMQIAMHDERHQIVYSEFDHIEVMACIAAGHSAKWIDMPRVIFRRRNLETR